MSNKKENKERKPTSGSSSNPIPTSGSSSNPIPVKPDPALVSYLEKGLKSQKNR